MVPVLKDILESVQSRLNSDMEKLSMFDLKKLALKSPIPKNFKTPFRSDGINIISEIKFASPSEGDINTTLKATDVAKDYIENGAKALSVLTERDHFKGDYQYIKDIRAELPDSYILMKDFLIDEYQIAMARYLGANAVLFIVAVLGEEKLEYFIELAKLYALTPLIEVHDKNELDIALKCRASLIGINNRNLKTMEIDLKTSSKLIKTIKDQDCLLISESGIKSKQDINTLKQQGFNGFLIGTSFMKSDCPGKMLKEFL